MLNKIFLQGRLVADPELRQTANGVPVATLRLAVDRDIRNKETGERATDFINVVAWRSTAEFVSRYFSKGRMAIVEGRLQIRNYTDRDGNKRTAAEVVADNIYFGDSKRDSESAGGYGGYSAPAPANYGAPAAPSYGSPAPSYGSPAPGYAAAPAPNYGAPVPGEDQFAELSEDDGELPF
jgi:single-strand DNA-binding protein